MQATTPSQALFTPQPDLIDSLSRGELAQVHRRIEEVLQAAITGSGFSPDLQGEDLILACEELLDRQSAETQRDFRKGFIPLYRELQSTQSLG